MSDTNLRVNRAGQNLESVIHTAVTHMKKDINKEVRSRATNVANILRSTELHVLKGERSGKVYRKYPYKAKYRASAPGEAPARRFGDLHLHWKPKVQWQVNSNGISAVAAIESGEKYAYYLENGKGMAPRPFVEKIKEQAKPEIVRILNEPYS